MANMEISEELNTTDELYQMRQKIRQRRRKRRNRIIIISIIAAAIVLLIVFIMSVRTYSSYKIVSSAGREDEEAVGYEEYQKGYIRYSTGGAEYVDASGGKKWNIAYSMSSPQCKINGDMVAVGDIKGNKIMIFNKGGQVGAFETKYSILQLEVARSGAVAAVLQNNSEDYINLYNKDGRLVYTVKTSLEGEGYPVDIAISGDAAKLAVSFVKTSGANVSTRVAFYDFSKSNTGNNDRVVGEFNNFDGKIIGAIGFISDTTPVAVSENSVTYYTFNGRPQESKKTVIDGEISKVIWGDRKMALVMPSGNEEHPNRIMVYNASGSRTCDRTYGAEYDTYNMSDGRVIMKGNHAFGVMDASGKFITQQKLDNNLLAFISNGGKSRYFLINERYVQRIRLK
ncbi:MAG: hypothetical protein KHZ87_00355 [Clostridiales bacterium]|nr:hypothetical protein [Clostridiales bacterium]MBS5877597.1 hypothetical protein [Clostridiales bacterium]